MKPNDDFVPPVVRPLVNPNVSLLVIGKNRNPDTFIEVAGIQCSALRAGSNLDILAQAAFSQVSLAEAWSDNGLRGQIAPLLAEALATFLNEPASRLGQRPRAQAPITPQLLLEECNPAELLSLFQFYRTGKAYNLSEIELQLEEMQYESLLLQVENVRKNLEDQKSHDSEASADGEEVEPVEGSEDPKAPTNDL
jgi:hypothetical protein